MTPSTHRIIITGAGALALSVGWGIAQDEWVLPILATLIAFGVLLARLSPFSFVTSIFVALFFGYLVGNRGFAQLSPVSSLPLFPAELGLAASLVLIAWSLARNPNSHFAFSMIDRVVFAWFLYGTVRLLPCLPANGFLALRDYAMVYYSLFYFVARYEFQNQQSASAIVKAIRWGTAIMLPLYTLFELFPGFFLETMTVRSVPLIYYKGDLAGTFFVIGAIAWYFHYEGQGKKSSALVISLLQVAAVVETHNRASLLALAVVVGLLGLRGHLRLLRALMLMVLAAGICVALWVETGKNRWEDTPIPNLVDRLASMVDLNGRINNDDESKGDNNRFRTVWWKTVAEDTVAENPWLGLGFGADLTSHFLQIYYPDSSDEFTARSPHCFPLTVFARMGVLGLLGFATIFIWLGIQTYRALSLNDPFAKALPLCGALAIGVSACFGVVLEGPMGAVLFWSLLGMAINMSNPQENLDNARAPA